MRATATRFGLLVGAAIALSAVSAAACGIAWQKPSNHFDGINERGFVSYWDQITELDFGSGFKVPLIVNFRSNRDAVSPYGGYGWLVPLLESNVVQLEENRFMLVQPDGWNRYFGRKNSSEATLLGDGGWAAELKGNIFTAWASCGWKLIYANGKISSMVSPDNRRFDWVRSGDRVTEIREGGTTRLVVKWNGANELAAIEANGQEITFGRGDKPRIQNTAGQNVVAAIDRSLTCVAVVGGLEKTYEFGVNDKLNPTFKTGDRLIVWNPATKLGLSDGGWSYQIMPDPENGYAAIGRKNANGQSEFWHKNRNKGIEIVEGLDGIRKITTTFVNGKLAGSIRKVVEERQGKSEIRLQNSFDEQGRLIASQTSGGKLTRFEYKDDERTESRYVAEKLVRQMRFNGNRLDQTTFEDGSIETNQYSGDIRTCTLVDSKGKTIAIKKYKEDLLFESQLESRVEKYFYEPNTRRVDRIEWDDGTLFKFDYDNKGRQIASYRNNVLVWFRYNEANNLDVTAYYNRKGEASRIIDSNNASELSVEQLLAQYPILNQHNADRYLRKTGF